MILLGSLIIFVTLDTHKPFFRFLAEPYYPKLGYFGYFFILTKTVASVEPKSKIVKSK